LISDSESESASSNAQSISTKPTVYNKCQADSDVKQESDIIKRLRLSLAELDNPEDLELDLPPSFSRQPTHARSSTFIEPASSGDKVFLSKN
jgi:hypothetical protein